jgi:hypothetical protein
MNQTPTLKPRLLLIEDDAERIALFRQWVVKTPYVLVEATSGGQAMGVVNRGGEGVAGIMLDHDLNTSPKTLQDQITSGSNVVASIIKHIPKTVPILVHSMNVTKGEQMFRRLQGSGFSATRIRMAVLDEHRFLRWLEDVSECWEDRNE